MAERAGNYDCLKLGSQLCFPLYACSKEIIRRYKPFLDQLDLTYTQYITMMAMWEHGEMNVKELGKCLYLDSGTLTPVLKKLESKGYLRRNRSRTDERHLSVTITEAGMDLRERAVEARTGMACCVDLSEEDAQTLYELLYRTLESINRHEAPPGQ
ncbi:MAG: MarR family transcriptional regulator [Eubacteriales bacterium]|nr:MarR family transcriptional regulator [Eubacteriales bacterium]